METKTAEEREVDGYLAEGVFLLQLARPELRPFSLVWDFSPLLTRTGGLAAYRPAGVHHIELSAPLWRRASPSERRWLVLHELCHIVDGVLHGRTSGHGEPWKNLMRALRVEPRRCHRIGTKDVKREI